ncbi:hypothetical protein Q3G72_027341 [Acer saccharum]|nr:hypothetical protein Q3G72_027341 [Acer saccharum]
MVISSRKKMKAIAVVGKSDPLGQNNNNRPPVSDSMSLDGPCLEHTGETGILGHAFKPPSLSSNSNPTNAIVPISKQKILNENGYCGEDRYGGGEVAFGAVRMLSLSQKNQKNAKGNSPSTKQRSPSCKLNPKTRTGSSPPSLSILGSPMKLR